MTLYSGLLMLFVDIYAKNTQFGNMNPILGKLEVTHDLGLWLAGKQGHREFPFGNSREYVFRKIPAAGKSREFCRVLHKIFTYYNFNFDNCSQGRRHGFESGGTNSASEANRKIFLTPRFLASGGGTKYCQNTDDTALTLV